MRIHLIGIGGIGVSALAQYYLSKGHQVSGSDLVASEITNLVKEKGIKVSVGNSSENIKKDFDLVVYSPAVKKDNPELLQAKKFKIQIKSYPEALGALTKEYYTIAICGAHGKTTTTAMIALVLAKAKLDPTVIIGTKMKEFGGSNFREGKGKFLVIEACEYDASFLQYSPKIIVVTNVDKEHLDYFKTFANVKNAFKKFILKLPHDGFLVFNKDDKNIPQINKSKFKDEGYSLKSQAKKVEQLKKVLKVPGQHNIYNALASLQVANILGIPERISLLALREFKGTWRRFEVRSGKAGNKEIILISDYAHHPNEILATLIAARGKYPRKNIWCIFQPHQHQRTYYLFNDFVKTFRSVDIDKIIITDIYDVAGRETKKINNEVSSEKLVERINKKNVCYLTLCDIEKFVKDNIKSGEVLIVMGAGNVYNLVEKF
jgi:UDP-N-acetylmuramate--alanine ligase